MPYKNKQIKLLDLIDVAHLQQLQDFFAKAIGVACITLDNTGSVTNPSNYCDFCKLNIKNNKPERIECDLHDPKWVKLAAKKNKPLIFKCRTGLTSFIVPIVINDQHLGAIVGGQIFTEPPNEEVFRQFAKEDNINEDEYIINLRKIKILSAENLKAAINLLSIMTNYISEIGRKNFEIIKKNERESLYKNMVETIRSSLNIEETLTIISQKVAELFDIQRVAIIEFPNRENLQKFNVRKEYKTNKNVKSSQEVKGYGKICEYAATQILKNNQPLVVNDIENSKHPDYFCSFYLAIGVKSVMWLPIMSENKLWGFVSISKTEKYNWVEEDIQLLESVASQLFLAINQAELYTQEKQLVRRETLLRKIVEVLRSKLDPEEIKNYFITATGAYFKADRCIFVDYSQEKEKFLPFRLERLKSNKIKSLIGTDTEIEFPEFSARLKTGKNIIIRDVQKTILKKKLHNYESIKTLNKSDTKSDYGLVVKYKEQIMGILIIHFTTEKKALTSDELDFLKVLRDQVGIALYQSKLYSTTKEQAEREALLRKTIEFLRSKFDTEEIKKYFIEITRAHFNADRCLYIDFDKKSDKFLPISIENLKSSEIQSFIGLDVENNLPEFCMELKKGKNVIIKDLEKFLSKRKTSDFISVKTLSIANVKSDYALVVKHENQINGLIVLHFVNEKRVLTHAEFEFLKILRNQVAIALNQAELYSKTKQQAERETLLRNITEAIRSSLELNKTESAIVNEIGKMLNADRVFIVNFKPETNIPEVLDKNSEYLSSPDISSYVGFDFSSPDVKEIAELHKKNEILIIEDIDKFINENNFQGTLEEKWLRNTGLKTATGVQIKYGEKMYGVLSIHFIKKSVYFSNEQIDFIKTLGAQIGIALHQAHMFEKEKITAQRETLLRNIAETIRSSLDIKETKQKIVDIIGKTLKADRCFIIEFDKDKDKFSGIENEYLSSDKITKYSDEDVNIDVPNFIYAFKKGKPIIIDNKGIYVDGGEHEFIAERNAIERYNVNSAYGFPIFYNKMLLGVLGIHYVNTEHETKSEEINFLLIVVNQIAIAIHQAKLYQDLKQSISNQNAILNNLPFMAWLKNTKGQILAVNNTYAQICNIPIINIIGKTYFDLFPKKYAESYHKEDNLVMDIKQTISSVDLIAGTKGEIWHETYKSPIFDEEGQVTGTVGISIDMTEKKESFLELLRRQKEIIKAKERESLLRRIFEAMRSSLDINIIKNTIVEEVGKALNADRCLIRLWSDNTLTKIEIEKSAEYLKDKDIMSIVNVVPNKKFLNYLISVFYNNQNVSVTDIESLSIELELMHLLKKFNVKSMYSCPIRKDSAIAGYIIVEFKNKVALNSEDIDLLNTIATQSGIALHQAELYDMTQIQAEREKINRKIIEILRGSLDKKTIKHLFVQNIGKLFKADRVFFSEYDSTKKMYLPVDKFSEYLSNPQEKSFIGYDWSQETAKEYIQPILEKRELLIDCWNEYIKTHTKSANFIALFEDADVQSSYNMPVLYQEKIIGYFCIEFTKASCNKLKEEDINRIRNICAQAAIALHHSDLYINAIESARSKEKFIEIISNELQIPLSKIINVSMQLLNKEINKDNQTDFFNEINENYKLLLDLKNNINNIAQIEAENFKLNYEQIDSEQLIMDLFSPIKHIAENKKIIINIKLSKAYIYADKLRVKQILYGLLINIINITPENGNILLESHIQGKELIISIINFGAGLDFDAQNKIFEILKQLDSSSTISRKNINLGFSIAQKLIELHHGHINVDSTEDKGTKLWFTLPEIIPN